jgi:nuclear GTP-binding protein
VCATSATAGQTTSLQHVQLERGLRIVDSPGVVFDEGAAEQQASSILLRNVLKPQDITDPRGVVRAIVERAGAPALQRIYGLPEFEATDDLVTMLALKGGRLGKVSGTTF